MRKINLRLCFRMNCVSFTAFMLRLGLRLGLPKPDQVTQSSNRAPSGTSPGVSLLWVSSTTCFHRRVFLESPQSFQHSQAYGSLEKARKLTSGDLIRQRTSLHRDSRNVEPVIITVKNAGRGMMKQSFDVSYSLRYGNSLEKKL